MNPPIFATDNGARLYESGLRSAVQNRWFTNGFGLVSGGIQVGVGGFIGIATGWTGVGAVGGGLLVVNGASTFVTSAGNLGSLYSGQAPVLNNSGFVGMTTSTIAFATNTPYSAADARLATFTDMGVGLLSSGVSFASVPNLVSFGNTYAATNALGSFTRAGQMMSQTGTTVAELSAYFQAGTTPAIMMGNTAVSLAAISDVLSDTGNALALLDMIPESSPGSSGNPGSTAPPANGPTGATGSHQFNVPNVPRSSGGGGPRFVLPGGFSGGTNGQGSADALALDKFVVTGTRPTGPQGPLTTIAGGVTVITDPDAIESILGSVPEGKPLIILPTPAH